MPASKSALTVTKFQGEICAIFPPETVRKAIDNGVQIANGFLVNGEFFLNLPDALQKVNENKTEERRENLISFFNSSSHRAPYQRGRKGGYLQPIAANSHVLSLVIDHILSDPDYLIKILQS